MTKRRPVALVTGGSRGIGAAIAQLAATRGYDISISYQSDHESAERVLAACRKAGAKAVAFKSEVSDEKQVERLFDDTTKALGVPTHIVNNAGVTGKTSRLEDSDPANIRRCIEINVLGTFWVSREAARRLSTKRGGPGGVIVNISSIAARLGAANAYLWYAASKGAVESLTFGMGQEVAQDGIRVNVVTPGMTRTDIHDSTGEPGRMERLTSRIPMNRVAEPEEIAEAVLFMLSDAASFITASSLTASGGR